MNAWKTVNAWKTMNGTMSNPLLETFDRLLHGRRGFSIELWERRGYLCHEYAWAIPTDEAISAIAGLGKIVEMGAGRGYWASLISAAGGDVIAYDVHPPDGAVRNHYHHLNGSGAFYPVRVGEPSVLEKHSDRALFLCWPPYDEQMAAQCLSHWKGDVLAYVGESAGGCTGDDEFHEALSEMFTERAWFRIPQWPGINDYLAIYDRHKE